MMNLCALFSLGERVCAGAGDHAGPGADAPAQGASLWDPARGGGGGGGARGGGIGGSGGGTGGGGGGGGRGRGRGRGRPSMGGLGAAGPPLRVQPNGPTALAVSAAVAEGARRMLCAASPEMHSDVWHRTLRRAASLQGESPPRWCLFLYITPAAPRGPRIVLSGVHCVHTATPVAPKLTCSCCVAQRGLQRPSCVPCRCMLRHNVGVLPVRLKF